MPCNCDHLEPTTHEAESKRAAQLYSYVLRKQGAVPPKWVNRAAEHVYGDTSRLNELTKLLCALCRNMGEKEQSRIIYDGRDPEARNLADWWQAHLKADEERIANERQKKAIKKRQAQALKKLTPADRKVFGV